MCEELANAYNMCVCASIHLHSMPFKCFEIEEKKAVLAYWDGGGLLTACPITICLFTHMQMFERCCENDEMRGWVGLPRAVGMAVHV